MGNKNTNILRNINNIPLLFNTDDFQLYYKYIFNKFIEYNYPTSNLSLINQYNSLKNEINKRYYFYNERQNVFSLSIEETRKKNIYAHRIFSYFYSLYLFKNIEDYYLKMLSSFNSKAFERNLNEFYNYLNNFVSFSIIFWKIQPEPLSFYPKFNNGKIINYSNCYSLNFDKSIDKINLNLYFNANRFFFQNLENINSINFENFFSKKFNIVEKIKINLFFKYLKFEDFLLLKTKQEAYLSFLPNEYFLLNYILNLIDTNFLYKAYENVYFDEFYFLNELNKYIEINTFNAIIDNNKKFQIILDAFKNLIDPLLLLIFTNNNFFIYYKNYIFLKTKSIELINFEDFEFIFVYFLNYFKNNLLKILKILNTIKLSDESFFSLFCFSIVNNKMDKYNNEQKFYSLKIRTNIFTSFKINFFQNFFYQLKDNVNFLSVEFEDFFLKNLFFSRHLTLFTKYISPYIPFKKYNNNQIKNLSISFDGDTFKINNQNKEKNEDFFCVNEYPYEQDNTTNDIYFYYISSIENNDIKIVVYEIASGKILFNQVLIKNNLKMFRIDKKFYSKNNIICLYFFENFSYFYSFVCNKTVIKIKIDNELFFINSQNEKIMLSSNSKIENNTIQIKYYDLEREIKFLNSIFFDKKNIYTKNFFLLSSFDLTSTSSDTFFFSIILNKTNSKIINQQGNSLKFLNDNYIREYVCFNNLEKIELTSNSSNNIIKQTKILNKNQIYFFKTNTFDSSTYENYYLNFNNTNFNYDNLIQNEIQIYDSNLLTVEKILETTNFDYYFLPIIFNNYIQTSLDEKNWTINLTQNVYIKLEIKIFIAPAKINSDKLILEHWLDDKIIFSQNNNVSSIGLEINFISNKIYINKGLHSFKTIFKIITNNNSKYSIIKSNVQIRIFDVANFYVEDELNVKNKNSEIFNTLKMCNNILPFININNDYFNNNTMNNLSFVLDLLYLTGNYFSFDMENIDTSLKKIIEFIYCQNFDNKIKFENYQDNFKNDLLHSILSKNFVINSINLVNVLYKDFVFLNFYSTSFNITSLNFLKKNDLYYSKIEITNEKLFDPNQSILFQNNVESVFCEDSFFYYRKKNLTAYDLSFFFEICTLPIFTLIDDFIEIVLPFTITQDNVYLFFEYIYDFPISKEQYDIINNEFIKLNKKSIFLFSKNDKIVMPFFNKFSKTKINVEVNYYSIKNKKINYIYERINFKQSDTNFIINDKFLYNFEETLLINKENSSNIIVDIIFYLKFANIKNIKENFVLANVKFNFEI